MSKTIPSEICYCFNVNSNCYCSKVEELECASTCENVENQDTSELDLKEQNDDTNMKDFEDQEITLLVNEINLKCSKRMLINCSDYFKAMFKGNFLEKDQSSVELKGVDSQDMKYLIHILNDERCINDIEDIFGAVKACKMFLFDHLKQKILTQLQLKLNRENCLEIWFKMEKIEKCPLVLMAKSMALHEFNSVVFEHKTHLKFTNKTNLFHYLSHINLQCDSELDVFKAGIQWYENCYNSRESHEKEEFLCQLLECIDFKHASLAEIEEMKQQPEVQKFPVVCHTLDCIIGFRNTTEEIPEISDKIPMKILECFRHSKKRYWPKQPLFLVKKNETNGSGEVEHSSKTKYSLLLCNNQTNSLDSLGEFPFKKVHNLHGFAFVDYNMKIYLFGGEFNIGSGSWNKEVWSLAICTKFEQKKSMPYPRRHFESSVCGSNFYVVGGTGAYRVIQDNMFYYEFENDNWSKLIELPCSGKQIRCCNYNNQLFIFSISDKCGYLFEHKSVKWQKIIVKDPTEIIPDQFVPLGIFCYNDNIYLKGDKLIEMKLKEDMLHVTKLTCFSHFNIYDYVENLYANDKYVYTMYRHLGEDGEIDKMSLEILDLDTLKVEYLFKHTFERNDNNVSYEICVENTAKLTLFHHWSLLTDEFINMDEIDC